MQYMSFGPDAGHLMEELSKQAGAQVVGIDTVLVRPEADQVALGILRDAAQGGWVVELLGADTEPDCGRGEQIRVRDVSREQIGGDTLDWETAIPDGGYVRMDLRTVQKIHIF